MAGMPHRHLPCADVSGMSIQEKTTRADLLDLLLSAGLGQFEIAPEQLVAKSLQSRVSGPPYLGYYPRYRKPTTNISKEHFPCIPLVFLLDLPAITCVFRILMRGVPLYLYNLESSTLPPGRQISWQLFQLDSIFQQWQFCNKYSILFKIHKE